MRPPRTTTDATASVCTHQRRYDAGRLLHDGDDAPPGDDEGPPRCVLEEEEDNDMANGDWPFFFSAEN